MHFTFFKNKLSAIIFISAIYFIGWGAVVLIFPSLLTSTLITSGNTPLIFWDLMGIITIVLGIGIIIASFNPYRHWPILFLVTLFHFSVIGGFIYGYSISYFNSNFLQYILFNHIIWLVPNIAALYLAYKRNYLTDEILIDSFSEHQYPLELFDTIDGKNIFELTKEGPVMLVFLRHFGCPFCKDSLLKLQEYKQRLEEKGITIVLIYMVDEKIAAQYLHQYQLQNVLQVSDPEEIFYKSFKLRKGTFTQLFGAKVWMRWIELAVTKKLFNTKPEGNYSQMPGMFLLVDGKIVKQYIHTSVADTPDYSMFLNN